MCEPHDAFPQKQFGRIQNTVQQKQNKMENGKWKMGKDEGETSPRRDVFGGLVLEPVILRGLVHGVPTCKETCL